MRNLLSSTDLAAFVLRAGKHLVCIGNSFPRGKFPGLHYQGSVVATLVP